MTTYHRGFAAMVAVAFAGVLSLTACAAPERGEESQATIAPSSPSPSPTAVVRNQPTPPIEGGCDELVLDPRFSAVTGAVEAVSATGEPWSIGFETAGGLSCSIEAQRFSGEVFALPAEVVTPELAAEFAEPECRLVYDSIECTASTTASGLWVLATTYAPDTMENQPAPSELVSTLEAAVTILAEGEPFGVTPSASSWSRSLDCDRVGVALDPAKILGPGEIFPTRYQEGRGPLDRYLADAVSTSPRCDWLQISDFREIGFVAIPDADWAWERVSLGAEAATVGDRPAVLRDNEARREVVVSDGVNLLVVSSVNLTDAETVAAAESVLASLPAAP